MKLVHLSDLHIGKMLHGYSLKEDQRYILHQIVEQVQRLMPDAVVIAGDVYDKSAPSGEAVSLFDEFLTELSEVKPVPEVMIIAGNHDSMDRLNYAGTLLKKLHLHFACYLPKTPEEYLQKVTLQDGYGAVDFYLLPFCKPGYVRQLFPEGAIADYHSAIQAMIEREQIRTDHRNVLVSHQFYTSGTEKPECCDSELPSLNVGGLDNVDVSAVRQFDYVALGHIHGRQRIGADHIRYCGTPLKYSVSESRYQKSMTVVTLGEKGTAPVIEEIPLHPLRDVRTIRGEFADVIVMDRSEDYISVTLTDETEMAYRPVEQLKERFPQLLEVNVDNTRTRSRMQPTEAMGVLQSPMELFAQFYRERHGYGLNAEQEAYIQEILDEIEEEVRT
ncbi:MAG: exonuclease SbcCD subunit D [Lachnospiraceae bacterium]|nr:exonuclease SbcCD subunit D [Lachnospiraceae bacterium]